MIKAEMNDGSIYNIGVNGNAKKFRALVDNIKTIYNSEMGNPIGVIVKFLNGDEQKAIVSENDTFDWENGVAICVMKEFLCTIAGVDSSKGTYLFNSLVKSAIKSFELSEEIRKEIAEDEEIIKRKREKRYEKKKKRAEKRMREFCRIMTEELFNAVPAFDPDRDEDYSDEDSDTAE